MGEFGEAKIGIILAKKNTILGTGSEHAVRLIYALINKVINENTNIGLVTTKDKRLLFHEEQMGIHTGNNSLRSGFFIAGGTIHLPCQKEVVHHFGAEGMMQELRVKVVVLDGVGRLKEHGILQTFYRMHSLHLDLQRKRRREALEIVLRRVHTLRFQEKLMRILPGKSSQLVLNAGTITRPLTMNETGEKRRPVKTGSKYFVHLLVGMKKVTIHLHSPGLNGRRNVEIREALGTRVSFLTSQLGKVDGPDVKTGRGSGFHPLHGNSHRSQFVGNSIRCLLPYPASFEGMLANKHFPVQEGSGRQNYGPCVKNCPRNCTNAGNYAILNEKISRKIRVNA